MSEATTVHAGGAAHGGHLTRDAELAFLREKTGYAHWEYGGMQNYVAGVPSRAEAALSAELFDALTSKLKEARVSVDSRKLGEGNYTITVLASSIQAAMNPALPPL